MRRLGFACVLAPGVPERQALLLAASVRTFGGSLADSPVWVLLPSTDGSLPASTRRELAACGAHLIPFEMDPALLELPFATKVFASAAAESQARGQVDNLAWMDTDSLVLKDPRELLLADHIAVGCRPVDLAWIGSAYDEPLDPFWRFVYECCRAPESRVFPMTTSVDQKQIRAYFNAGLLVVRPQSGLLQSWRDNLLTTSRQAGFEEYLRRDTLYRVFVHQAVLAGTILSLLRKEEIQELPHWVNYPLHLHARYPADRRPARLNDLTSARYEEFFDNPQWSEILPAEEPVKSWLTERLGANGG